MADMYRHEQADQRAAHQHTSSAGADRSITAAPQPVPTSALGILRGESELVGRGNGPVRAAILQRMQQTQGNHMVQRVLAGGIARSGSDPITRDVSRFLQRATPSSVAVQRCGGEQHAGCPCMDEDPPVQRQIAGPSARVQRMPAGAPTATGSGGVTLQRSAMDSESCKKIISDDDWVVKGAKNGAGYDTSNYYKDVAAKIITAAEQRGVAFDRALYMAAQARAEQGEGDPKATSYRRFNIQVTKAMVEATQGRFTATPSNVIHTTSEGRKYKWLRTVEQGSACTAIKSPVEADGFCHPAAPFYFYDSMEEATDHYLSALKDGPFGAKGAKDILWNTGPAGAKGGIVEFGNALKKGGYGSDLNYVPKLCDSYNTVVTQMKVILKKAVETKQGCKQSAEDAIKEIEGDDGKGGKLAEAKKVLEAARKKRDDGTPDSRRGCGLTVEEDEAQKAVRRLEGELAERKRDLQQITDWIKTLEDRLKSLPEKAIQCPPQVNTKAKKS